MTERKITVFIYLPGETVAVPAGIFTHDSDAGIGTFTYGRRYVERDDALPVDPIALPMGVFSREAVKNGGLYGSFRDAVPDYWGRLVIAAEAKIPPEALTETDFLIATNATRVGNLDFRTSVEEPEPKLIPPHFNQLAEVLDAAGKIQAGEETEDHLLHLLRQGTSMGGARPKCTVEWEDSLWIAKFPAKEDSLNIPLIEYATLTLAGLAGIEIPEVRIVSVGEKDVFLSRRFDREKKQSGWLRRGFISTLSLVQWDERDRLSWDYAAIADIMRRYMSVSDIKELFRCMVFNILVRNTDDHPRNHGVVINGEKIFLSPAYDIVPTLTQAGVGTDFRLAMSIGEQGREATFENALSRSARFGLSREDARNIIESLIVTVQKWCKHFEECGLTGKEIDALTPSFDRCNNAKYDRF